MSSRAHAFFRFLIKHRVMVLFVHGFVFVAALVGASGVRVDYSAEQFFVFDGREREVYDEFKRYFPREDLQVSAFLEVPGRLNDEAYRTLERLAEAFREAGLESVRWLGATEFVEETLEDGQPAVQFIRLEDEGHVTDERLRELVEARREHPLYAGSLWSRDLRVFAVHGYLDPSENNDARRRALTAALQSDIGRLSDGGSGRIVLNGLPVLRVTVPLALEADIQKLLGTGLVISLVVLWLYFQRLRLALLCFASVVPAAFVTLGIMGFTGRAVSVLTGAVPIVVLVVAVSDAVHLVVGSRRHWRGGATVPHAVVEAFASLARACFFTSITTALGFAGLVATRNRLVGEFGVVTALAVLVAYVVTLTLLPVLLSFAGGLGPERTRAEHVTRGVVERVVALLALRPGWVTASFAVCLGAGLALGSGLRVDALLIDDIREDDPIVEELRWIEDGGYGVFQVNVFVSAGETPPHSPEALAWTEDLQSFAEADPVVLGSIALPQFIDELWAAYGSAPSDDHGDEARAEVPSAEEVAELLFLSELQGESALDDVYLREEGVQQIIIQVRDAGSLLLSPFLERLEERLQERPPPGGTAAVTGTVKLSQVLWDQLISRFSPGVVFSVLLVWAALTWMFRSVRIGLLALLPNLVPLGMLLGVLRLAGLDLKPSTIVVFAIAFGLVADDTIHFLGALAGNLRASVDLEGVLIATIREVGPALVVATVVVCTGFSVLMLSRFQVLFLIGSLTAAAALFALAADLVGFPALLRIAARRQALQSLLTRRAP